MNQWIYKDKPLETIPKGFYGFIYELELDDGTKYIGKKSFYENKTLPALKNGKQRPNSKRIGKNKNGKRIYYDIVSKESNWKDYYGSSKLVDKNKVVKRTILELCETKRYLTYAEVKWQFKLDVLEKDEYLNENILGKFYKGGLK